MSIDIWIKEKNWETDSINHTSNCSGMWCKALGIPLRDLDGTKAEDAIPVLVKGIADMLENPSVYEEMNPPNEWGSYESAKKYLEKLLEMCQKYPDGNIEISY